MTAVFTGPHAYVSPNWYVTQGLVPTWNYAAVHVTGPVSVVEDTHDLAQLVDELADIFERDREDPWIPDYPQAMLDAIVGFRLNVTSIEVKFKLSQNRSAEDRARVTQALESEHSVLAEMMKR